jgi:hypothetical protein
VNFNFFGSLAHDGIILTTKAFYSVKRVKFSIGIKGCVNVTLTKPNYDIFEIRRVG